MNSKLCLAGLAVITLATSGRAATLFNTGFEAAQGYTVGSQLSANANWNGDGQDTTGWAISSTAVGGSAAASGTQYVLVTSPTAGTPTRFQWTVTPVTDFSGGSVITESASVKLASPATGSVNRTTLAGLQMYDASTDLMAELYLIVDAQNLFGNGATHSYIGQFFPQDDQTNNPGFIYDLGTTSILNTYYSLSISLDFAAHTVTGSVNGTPLTGAGAFTSVDFHDADIVLGRGDATAAGTAARGGFDNYSVVQSAVPEPASLTALVAAGLSLVARRRRA